MIKNNNFESNMRLLTSIFLFSWIMACILCPCRVFSSEAMHPVIILSDEEIATFDEDEATATLHEHEETATLDENEEEILSAEPAANISSLLHAEHYQPPVYFPERQKRYPASSTWMRIIPFAVLIMLALATTRLFGKRGRKAALAGNRPASGKGIICICVGIFLIIATAAGVIKAQISYGIKDAVVSLLGDGRELYQRSIQLTPDVRNVLEERLWWEPEESSIKFYYSKTGEGAVEACVFVLSDTLLKCGGRHRYCIKVSSKGQVEGVKILELTCPYSFPINNERFLNRLKIFNATNGDNESVDGVTGATISSKLTVMVVRRALLLFELLKENGYA